MMTSLFAALIVGQAPSSAAELLTKMLGHYRNTVSAVGSIKTVITDGAGKVGITTELQYERPSKLYIRQSVSGGKVRDMIVTSDGELFSYDVPRGHGRSRENSRLVELVRANDGFLLEVAHIYGAAVNSLHDRSAALDIVMSRPEDLRYLRNQWATLEILREVEIAGKKATVVGGRWRQDDGSTANGSYEISISAEGELLRYVQREPFVVDKRTVYAVYTYDVDVRINEKPKPELFKVILN